MSRRIILFVVAIAIAVTGCGAVLAYARQADARALAGAKPVQVLVASGTIAAGTSVKDVRSRGLTQLESLPAKATPHDALRNLDAVGGKVAATMVVPGQVLVPALFTASAPATASTALPVPAGKMAVSVSLKDPSRVGGYLQPGNEVAVFDTFNAAEGSAAGAKTPSGDRLNDKFNYDRSTRLVLPRVLVLAVGDQAYGTSFKPTVTGAASTDGSLTVTLAVDQQQAQKLIQVAQVGQPWLALLTSSSKTAPSDGVDDRGLFR